MHLIHFGIRLPCDELATRPGYTLPLPFHCWDRLQQAPATLECWRKREWKMDGIRLEDERNIYGKSEGSEYIPNALEVTPDII